MSKNQDKKAKVLGQTPKNKSYFIPAVIVAGLLAVGGVFYFNGSDANDAPNKGTYTVGQAMNYSGQQIDMTAVTPEIANGKVSIDVKQLTEAKIVKFELANQTLTLPNGSTFNSLPILAYVAPSGRLVGAVSFCEPCSGTNFRIVNDTIFCTACGSTWTLEDLKGIQGGCLQYPPDEINYEVKDGKMIFDEKELRSWQPRQL